MNNKIILYISVLVTIFLLNSCTTITEGLSGKKKDSADVFMVKKKNPLVVPKEYNKLPKPVDEEDRNLNTDSQNINKKVRLLFSDLFKESGKEIDVSMSGQSLENSVLKKIKEN